MLDTRVEDLIEAYMNHYEVPFQEAVEIMIEDLQSATEETAGPAEGEQQ